MQHIRAVLRRAVVERRIRAETVELRDLAIDLFLDELQKVFTRRLIYTIPHDVLGEMFEDWVVATHHIDREQRIAALVADVRLSRTPFLLYRKGHTRYAPSPAPAPSANVVPLHSTSRTDTD